MIPFQKNGINPLNIMTYLLLCVIYLGCTPDVDQSEKASAHKLQKPTLITVTTQSKDLLFLFMDKKGEEQRVMAVKDIPETSRAQVQVIDLSLSPAERSSRHFVQVFDLRKANVDGSYPGRVVERALLEQALASAQALPEQPEIVLYSTAWCGVCKKARRFMKEKGLAFIEKDIEKDKSAARELQEKCERARVPLGGVPVIDVGGALMRGFDPTRLMSMLESK